jgi:glyoxylase-like metal-dependent hydrolase (beta-lactamase superfamily II)
VYSRIESSTTLVLAGEMKIIVDPSSKYSREKIVNALERLGLRPEDIDTVVLTHYHLDHVANYAMFRNARFFIHGNELERIGSLAGKLTLAVLKAVMREFGFSIGDFAGRLHPLSELKTKSSLKVIETFGHTGGSISLCVSGKKRIVISGDALTRMSFAEEFSGQPQNGDKAADLYSRSFARVLESGEIIVPGHDRPFMKSADGYVHLDSGVDLASV